VFVSFNERAQFLHGRQIVLSSGAIQTPALLMRSGIGPADSLKKHSIPIVQELPGVGRNLQNHPYVGLTTYLTADAAQPPSNPTFLQNWLRFSSHYPGCTENDMHLMPFNRCAWHAIGRRVGALAVSVLKAYSKGEVTLEGADPTTAPQVRFNLLSDARDEERLVRGTRFAFELLADPAVQKLHHEIFLPSGQLVARLSRRTLANRIRASAVASILNRARLRQALLRRARVNPDSFQAESSTLREFVRTHAQPQYHPCGTCRMGRRNEPQAVVDSAGSVFGVQALRIADASIFPTIPRGYTHFIVLMAAEKLADAIKEDWRTSVV
jgi:5-(hydroxymethyl)furfural/furfural oxidase